MLVGDAVSGLAEFGAIGVLALVVGGWFTWLGKWVIGKFTVMISDSNKVIQRNTDVVDSWKRQSGEQIKQVTELTRALNGLRSSSQECREDVKQIVQQAIATKQGD